MIRFALCATIVLLLGCGQGNGVPYTDHSRDPEAFALTIKQMVLDAVEDARRSPEPAESVDGIVAAFDGRLHSLPVGDYRPIYEELLSVASELYEEAERIDGRPEDLDQRLDELAALAEQLPGDVAAPGPPEQPDD